MGKKDLFQKRRQGRKKRRHEYLEPRANSFLIVTEGKCTEPSYFRGMEKIIRQARTKGYQVAWSNQSFEYWIYLHFYYSDAALHRTEWVKKLNDIFKQRQLGAGEYQKNCEDIYELVCKDGGVDRAIRNAKRRMESFDENGRKPSEFDPGTTVYKLVEDLKKFTE